MSPWSDLERMAAGRHGGVCLPTSSPFSSPDATGSRLTTLYATLVALLSNQENPGSLDSQLIYFSRPGLLYR